jgi:hypothetical protein
MKNTPALLAALLLASLAAAGAGLNPAPIAALPAQTPFNATSMTPDGELEKHFRSPPASARPWVYWMWLRTD